MLSKQNLKPDTIKLLSLNVRGLSNFKKRRAIFSWCRKQKADLVFLQETHSCKEREAQWKKEWGAEIFFLMGTPQAAQALRTAHKLDCFFHAKHNNDIGTLCIIMTLATFKSLYGNATKRLKLPQIRKKSK